MSADVDTVLNEAESQLAEVERLYEASLRDEVISPDLRAKIKGLLENYRAALEYVSHDVARRFGTRPERSYFPIVRNVDDFDEQFDRQLAGVRGNAPHVHECVRDRQPFVPGFEWMADLAGLTNENKHRRLTPQNRVQATRIAGRRGGGRIGNSGAGIFLGEGASITMSGGASISFGGGPIRESNVERTILVDWLFEGTGRSALGTPRAISGGIRQVCDDVLSAAGGLPGSTS